MKKKLTERAIVVLRTVTVVSLILIALLVFKLLAGSKAILPNTDPDQLSKRIGVFTAQRLDVRRQWTGYGTTESIDSANVPARVTATVDRIPPDILEGAAVHKGQVLAELDVNDFQNQLEIAQQAVAGVDAMLKELDRQEESLNKRLKVETDDLALARDELARIKKLFEGNAANQKDVDAAERTELAAQRSLLQVEQTLSGIEPRREQLKAQRAELVSSSDTARLNVERCTITSPIDGVIQSVSIEVGESVSPGQQVARVVNLDRVQTPLSLPSQARPYVRVGDEAMLISTAHPGLTWRAAVKRITPEDDPSTRTFAAYVEVEQPGTTTAGQDSEQPALMPGVFIRGTLVASTSEQRIVIPRRSIRIERAMVVRDDEVDGHALKRLESRQVEEAYAFDGPVPEMGLPDESWAVLDAGIEPGDVVVLTPTRSLSDGQVIEPVDATESSAANSPAAHEDGANPQARRGDAR